MNFSDAIDAKGRVNRHVGHVNLTIFNDLHRIPFGFANSFLIEIQIKAAVNKNIVFFIIILPLWNSNYQQYSKILVNFK